MYVNEVPAVKQMTERDFVLLFSCFLPLGKRTHFRKHRYQLMSSSRFHYFLFPVKNHLVYMKIHQVVPLQHDVCMVLLPIACEGIPSSPA